MTLARVYKEGETAEGEIYFSLLWETDDKGEKEVSMVIVDYLGNVMPRGYILTITSDGYLVRQKGIDPELAERAGFDLDEQGRIRRVD